MFSTKEFIHFNMTDPAGILFFEQVFQIYHRAYEKWVTEKMPWKDWFQNPEWAVPIVSAKSDYKIPILAGSEVVVEFKEITNSNSSFQILCDIKNLDGKLHCQLDMTHVFISKSTKKSIQIPVEL